VAIEEHTVRLPTLNELATEVGTDKGPTGHNYTSVYPQYLDGLRDKPIKFLELGINQGYSVKMWEKYFSQAEMHFVDLSSQNLQYTSNRSTYHFINQSNSVKMKEFGQTVGPFHVIIDDASHMSHDTIAAFEVLMDFVEPGGLYIIEDLHLLYLTEWGGAGNMSAPALSEGSIHHYLRDRVEDVNMVGAMSGWASMVALSNDETRKRLNKFSHRLKSVHFYTGLCIMIMRDHIL